MTCEEMSRDEMKTLRALLSQVRLLRIRQPYWRVFKRELPLCGAKCRDGHSCKARAAWDETCTRPRNGRCRNHGGLSTGPRTQEGYERSQILNRRRHAEAVQRRQAQNGESKPGDDEPSKID